MTKKFFADRFHAFLAALICFAAVSSLAHGDDSFAITVGAQNKLLFIDPKGDQAAEVSVPTIAQLVHVSDVSFQVNYGFNSSGRLTAVLTPNEDAPAELHFTVLGKSVDADRAVVTLTFSSNLKNVTINSGYGGRVEVNSHRIRPSQPTP